MIRTMVIGLGNVGRAVLRAWDRVPRALRLVAACDAHGRFHDEAGLDPASVVRRKRARDYDREVDPAANEAWIREVEPELVIELSVTDFETGRPSLPHILTALDVGAHVVTSAKSHQRSRADIERIAAAARAGWRIFLDHAAHLAGIPVTEMVAGVGMRVTRIVGVLNGTTNFVLKRLEEGRRFERAIAEAVDSGYAERNWRYDVEGFDVGIKLVGLTRRLMERTLDLGEVELQGLSEGRKGIDGIEPEAVAALKAKGRRLRLVGEVVERGGEVRAWVQPRVLPLEHPFAQVEGFRNAVAIYGRLNDTSMDLFLAGPGAGADETASRVIGNLRYLADRLDWRSVARG